ncbi:MAG TPA: TIGR03560 family F420-dependent LLM class oxidoreductase [Candidatus Limnocylindrales bacterium]|jgi:alkanesulfonate monooxygenase
MRFALMIEPQQGLSYLEQLAIARTAEEAGFETLLRSDHYTSFPGAAGLPTTDAWTVVAGLARETERIRLGVLVSPVTYRIPGAFAKVVGTADEMSGGRIEVGLGAGWNEQEHAELGIPFPPLRERFDRLEEAVAIVHGLWTEPDGWSYDGRFWQVRDARLRPAPASGGRRHPHFIIGGSAGPRALRLAATYADEYDLTSASPASAATMVEHLDAACRGIGRDPTTIVRSAMTGMVIGRSAAEVEARLAAQVEMFGIATDEAEAWLDSRRDRWILGTPDEARAGIAAFAQAGVERLVLQSFLPRDLEMISQAGELVAQVAGA